MKRTPAPFMEPRPETEDEMLECLNESGYDAGQVNATISHDPWDEGATTEAGVNMTGYTAEVVSDEEGDAVFTTNGFLKQADLLKILDEIGIPYSGNE